jgi:zinc transporter ZupT
LRLAIPLAYVVALVGGALLGISLDDGNPAEGGIVGFAAGGLLVYGLLMLVIRIARKRWRQDSRPALHEGQ